MKFYAVLGTDRARDCSSPIIRIGVLFTILLPVNLITVTPTLYFFKDFSYFLCNSLLSVCRTILFFWVTLRVLSVSQRYPPAWILCVPNFSLRTSLSFKYRKVSSVFGKCSFSLATAASVEPSAKRQTCLFPSLVSSFFMVAFYFQYGLE